MLLVLSQLKMDTFFCIFSMIFAFESFKFTEIYIQLNHYKRFYPTIMDVHHHRFATNNKRIPSILGAQTMAIPSFSAIIVLFVVANKYFLHILCQMIVSRFCVSCCFFESFVSFVRLNAKFLA